MLEANPENVEAMETIVTINAFCREVNMLYATGGSDEATGCSFSSVAIINCDVQLRQWQATLRLFERFKDERLSEIIEKIQG
jgi:hypothetical protein